MTFSNLHFKQKKKKCGKGSHYWVTKAVPVIGGDRVAKGPERFPEAFPSFIRILPRDLDFKFSRQ